MSCCLAAGEAFQLCGYVAALIAVSILLSLGFRRSGVPGGAVLAGVAASFFLGPTMLGRMSPAWFEQVVIGGQEERRNLDILRGENAARDLARRELGIEMQGDGTADPAPAEERDRIAREELEAVEAWRQAQAHDRRILHVAALAVTGLFLVVAGLTRPVPSGPRPHIVQGLSVGVWSAMFPGLLMLIALRLMGVDLWSAVAAGAAMATGAVSIARTDLDAADNAEVGGGRLLVMGSGIATALAAAALVVCAVVIPSVDGAASAITLLACLVAGRFLPRLEWAGFNSVRDAALVPAMTALLAVRIEFLEHWSLWMIMAAIVLSGDGRWFGGVLGAMLSGARRWLRTMRLALGVMSAGTAQIAFAAFVLYGGLVEEPVAYALLAGAIVMDMTTNARRGMARRIEETELEIDNINKSAE